MKKLTNAEHDVLLHIDGKGKLPRTSKGKMHKRHDAAVELLKAKKILEKGPDDILRRRVQQPEPAFRYPVLPKSLLMDPEAFY